MKTLTCCAMTVLASQGLLSAQLVFDLAAVTASVPFDIEFLVFAVDAVGFAVFPGIYISMCRITSLVLVSFWVNRPIRLVVVLFLTLFGRHG